MNEKSIKIYSVAEVAVDDDTTIQAHWHRGSGVNIYVGGKQVDYFTDFSMKSDDDFVRAFADYLRKNKHGYPL